MYKRNLFFIFIFLFLIISLSSVYALGITPGRKIFDFSPLKEISSSFKVINSENREIKLEIDANGNLSNILFIEEKNIVLSPNSEKEMKYKLVFPNELPPGSHQLEISVVENSNYGSEGIGAKVGVVSQIIVRVPYPGKYAEFDFSVESAGTDEEVLFFLVVSNLGSESIDDLSVYINIFDSNLNKIGFISSKENSILSGNKKEFVYPWMANVPPGNYFAEVNVYYSGKNLSIKKEFQIGEKILELKSVSVKDFRLGNVAKFAMLVKNNWSSEVKNVYSQTNVFDKERKLISDFKSPTYDIPALGESTFYSYWDTEGVKEGIYSAVVYLRYGEKFSKKNLEFEVGKDSLNIKGVGYVISSYNKPSDKTNFLIYVIVFLVLLNILWFVIFRRKFKKRKDL